jgi:O-methyltransferase
MNPQELIQLVDGKNSCVPPHKLNNLWEVIKLVPEGDILEVGTWRGGTALMLAASASVHKPNSHVYVCDTFEGIVLAGPNDNFHKDGDFSGSTSKELVEDLLASKGLTNFSVHKGIFPRDTGDQITTNGLACVHVDVDVYEGHMGVFEWAQDKLVSGAVLIFDDYGSPTCLGATKAVHDYFDGREDFDLFVSPNLAYHTFALYKG